MPRAQVGFLDHRAGQIRMGSDDPNGWLAGGQTLIDWVARMKTAGLNIVVPQMRTGSQTHWDNDAGWPWSGNTQFQNLLDECEAQGIEVHGWLRVSSRANDILPEFAPGPATPAGFFDVSLPAFQDSIVELAIDLIDKYPKMKGLAWDFIRAGNVPNNSAANIAAYSEFSGGRDLTADRATPYVTPAGQWMRKFSRSALTSIIARVHSYARAQNPEFRFSAFTHPGLDTDFFNFNYRGGRDAVFWVEQGLIDYCWMMLYGWNARIAHYVATVQRELRDRPDLWKRFVVHANTYTDDGSVTALEPGQVVRRWDRAKIANLDGHSSIYHLNKLSDEAAAALGAGPNAIWTTPDWRIAA